jgi:hypothetical protein
MSGKRMKLLMCGSVFAVGMSVFVNGRRPEWSPPFGG